MATLNWTTVSFATAFLLLGFFHAKSQEYRGICDNPRNADHPFCDSSLSIDVRVQSLLASLTLDEKISISVHNWTGFSGAVEFGPYNWWGESLHGVAYSQAVHFRAPTEAATQFPQTINLASSFNKQLFFEVANATGNEDRAFYNVGNAGLHFWSPNVNIYRDPRWGRGHETPGEDPVLTAEYARLFVRGLQGEPAEQGGFLKASACCKHFAAHSVEEGRHSFNAVVNQQDMADTYLPAFKACVQDAGANCVMCAYSAINGIPACADKGFLTGVIREEWGLDGYIVSDCDAVRHVMTSHHYTDTPSETCHAVLDAGLDVECEEFFTEHLRAAIQDGTVPEAMLDTALARALRTMVRLGHFEKDAVRPYKDLQLGLIDSAPHQQLALEAARQSIVLLKNAPNARTGKAVLPLQPQEFQAAKRASMAAIGPHANGRSWDFLGNYHGAPPFVRVPVDEIRKYVPDLAWERGCAVTGDDASGLQAAEDLARDSEQVLLFVGISADVEGEMGDRQNLTFPGLQPELIRRVLAAAQQPVIMFVVSGGALDLSEYQNDPRVGAIIWAGYLGQSAGEAMADVMFGVYNPSGRVTQTWYTNDFIHSVAMGDMNMRPVGGAPGRTYRFFTGQPLYEFGFGLSYTNFQYDFIEEDATSTRILSAKTAVADEDCAVEFSLSVRNSGTRAGDHSVLWFLAPPGAGTQGRPIKSLHEFDRLNNIQTGESKIVKVCLNADDFQLADEQGRFGVVTGEWKLLVGNLQRDIVLV